MNGERVTTRDEHEALVFVSGEYRAAEGFKRLYGGEAWARDLPDVLPGGGIDGEDVAAQIFAWSAFLKLVLKLERLIALQHLDVELATVDGWAAAVCPLRGEGTVCLLKVALPYDLAAEVARGGYSVGKKEIHAISIRRGRRAGEVALVVPHELTALADSGAPFFFTGLLVVAKANELLLCLDGRGDENIVTPDDWHGGGDARKICGPFDTFSCAELHRQAGLAAGAILIGATPVGPVFGAGGLSEQNEG